MEHVGLHKGAFPTCPEESQTHRPTMHDPYTVRLYIEIFQWSMVDVQHSRSSRSMALRNCLHHLFPPTCALRLGVQYRTLLTLHVKRGCETGWIHDGTSHVKSSAEP